MAQQPATKPSVVEGDWVRTDTNGSGSFDNLTKTFKPAVLTPEGQAMMGAGGGRGGRGGGGRGGPPGAGGGRGGAATDPAEAHVVGQPYVTGGQTCRFGGAPQLGLEYDSEGFHLVMSKTDAIFMQERGAVRHVYLDGRALPTAATRPSEWFGLFRRSHRAGRHISGGDHRYDSRGSDCRRLPYSRESCDPAIRPSADGQHLTLKFTWADPKIYQTPHEYEYISIAWSRDRMRSKHSAMPRILCGASRSSPPQQ